jgi:hypothetical protein
VRSGCFVVFIAIAGGIQQNNMANRGLHLVMGMIKVAKEEFW